MTKEDKQAALVHLAEWFPQAFVLEKYLPHRPLKIRICPDILARCPVLTRRELGTVLGVYTSRVMYLQSLVAGAIRIDLDGNPAGEVSAADAGHAAARLAEITGVARSQAGRGDGRPNARRGSRGRQHLQRHRRRLWPQRQQQRS